MAARAAGAVKGRARVLDSTAVYDAVATQDTVTAWYKVPAGSANPRFWLYYRNSSGSWVFLTESGNYPSSSTWTQASWTTPTIPAGATNISVGMGLINVGSVTMDEFGLYATG